MERGHGPFNPGERLSPGQEYLKNKNVIEALLTDNHSELASKLRAQYAEKRREKGGIGVIRCSDSRLIEDINPSIAAIAASLFPEHLEKLFSYGMGGNTKNKPIEAVEIRTHFDLEKSHQAGCPCGCGGLDGRSALGEHCAIEKDRIDLTGYLERIPHPDAFIASLAIAYKAATKLHGRWALAAPVDHRTGEKFPVAAYRLGRSGKLEIFSTIPLFQSLEVLDMPIKDLKESLYAEGFPKMETDKLLNHEDLGEIFGPTFAEYEEKRRSILTQWPGFTQDMAKQNPSVVLVSDNLRPASIAYPHIGGMPGTIFQVGVPRYDDMSPIDADESYHEHMKKTANLIRPQLDYPLTHFSHAKTLFIQGRTLEGAMHLFELMRVNNPTIEAHLANDGTVVLAEFKAGILREDNIRIIKGK